jgi:hypothetical protein
LRLQISMQQTAHTERQSTSTVPSCLSVGRVCVTHTRTHHTHTHTHNGSDRQSKQANTDTRPTQPISTHSETASKQTNQRACPAYHVTHIPHMPCVCV